MPGNIPYERKAEGMAGLAKGLAIVEAFSFHNVLSVADAARASGATRAAARRCLLTLAELGYIEQSGREFRPLSRLRRLGLASSKREQLVRLAQPILEQGRNELSESVSLAVLDEDKVLFIARAEAEHIVSTGVRVGAHLPAYCSATGRVLLSQFPDTKVLAQLRKLPLLKRSPRTLTSPADILVVIQHAREIGYAISDEELAIGIRSLAVPVMSANAEIIAAISVSASSARVRNSDLRRRFLPVLRLCARSLEEAISQTAG
jgi:IclR family pca regulon transcriptional regulator